MLTYITLVDKLPATFDNAEETEAIGILYPCYKVRYERLKSLTTTMRDLLTSVNAKPAEEYERIECICDVAAKLKDAANVKVDYDYSVDFTERRADFASKDLIQKCNRDGLPVNISKVDLKGNWSPENILSHLASGQGPTIDVAIDCRNFKEANMSIEEFFNGLQDPKKYPRIATATDPAPYLKLKDWPSSSFFADKFPTFYADFIDNLPFPEYSTPNGKFNIM